MRDLSERFGLPTVPESKWFRNTFLARIFSNLLYHYASREKAKEVFQRLLKNYVLNKNRIATFDYSYYKVYSLTTAGQISRGLIVGTGHYGGFALVPFLVANHFQKNVYVLVLDNEQYYKKEMEQHERHFSKEYQVIPIQLDAQQSLFSLIKSVKSGQILLVYSDANYAQSSSQEKMTYCQFLGHKIKARPGIGMISQLTGAPIVFAGMNENNDTLTISDCLETTRAERENNFAELMQKFYSWLGTRISNCPENWFMWNLFHDLIFRNVEQPPVARIATSDILTLNSDKAFLFSEADSFYLHIVESGSNLKLSSSHLMILNELSTEWVTGQQVYDQLARQRISDKLLSYLSSNHAISFRN
jgi:predicted LPLAT superfamily acyltransferase